MFADVSAIIANCIWNIERKITAASFDCSMHKTQILFFSKMFFEISVQCLAAIKIFCEFITMKNELVYQISSRIFYTIEIAVIAVAWNKIAIFFVPLSVFNTEIFCQSVALRPIQEIFELARRVLPKIFSHLTLLLGFHY